MEDDGSAMRSEALVPMRMDDAGILLILERVKTMLEEQYQRAGSWFALVPDDYKAHVRTLAEENFPFFKGKFANNFYRFLEEMSRNWLMKFFVFESLARESGFTAALNGYITRNEGVNRSGIVCLTRSASYVLIGPGSCGTGAAMKYARVPFRNIDLGEEEIFSEGVTLEGGVATGNRLCTNVLSSSPLVSVFTMQFENEESGVIPEVMQDFHGQTTQCFARINRETLGE